MIAQPPNFSKRALDGAPLGSERQPGTDMGPGESFGQWKGSLEGNSGLSHPAISGIRLSGRSFYLSPQPSSLYENLT